MDQLMRYRTREPPSTLFNSAFKSTINLAVNNLLSLISTSVRSVDQKWIINQCHYLGKLWTRTMVWLLRVFIDYLPPPIRPSPRYFLSGGSSSTSMNLMVLDRYGASSSSQAIDRALSHILIQLNELPVTSRKYQLVIEMAENILEDNIRDGHGALQEINCAALSSAFLRTTNLLQQSLQSMHADKTETWPSQLLYSLPLGSYIRMSINGLRFLAELWQSSNKVAGGRREQEEDSQSVKAEKFAQEMLWITKKLKYSGAIKEALLHWSFSSELASLSLTAEPRVQSTIVLISAILIREAAKGETEVPGEVKCRLLLLWLPLFCYAGNGVTYPVLTAMEKAAMERVMEEIISSLPVSDQEIILTNWFKDFINSNSNWPSLQISYERWCCISRKLVM